MEALDTLARDLRYGWRRLGSMRLWSVVAVASLCIGISVPSLVFGTVQQLSAKPFVTSRGQDLGVLALRRKTGALSWREVVDRRAYRTLERSFRSLADLSASTKMSGMTFPGMSRPISLEEVSGGYFRTLRVRIVQGRAIDMADVSQRSAVVVIGSRLWHEQFGGRSVVGSLLPLGDLPLTIVGVAEPDFDGLDRADAPRTDAWVPLDVFNLAATGRAASTGPPSGPPLTVIGHLEPGRSLVAATAELTRAAEADGALSPPRTAAWEVVSLASIYHRDAGVRVVSLGTLIIALSLLVFVVASANLAGFAGAIAADQQHTVAALMAFGSSRRRLVSMISAEISILVGIALVIALAFLGVAPTLLAAEITVDPERVLHMTPAVSWRVFLGAIAIALLSLMLFRSAMWRQLRSASISTVLTTSLASGFGTRWTKSSRHMVRGQVAVSVVLLVGAAAILTLVIADARHPMGLDIDRVAVMELDLDSPAVGPAAGLGAVDQLLTITKGTDSGPIEASAVSSGLPIGSTTNPVATIRPVGTTDTSLQALRVVTIPTTGGLFRTLGIAVRHGTAFDEGLNRAEEVAVLSESTALDLFGSPNPVGKLISVTPTGYPDTRERVLRVIGIAADTDVGRRGRRDHILYVPLSQMYVPYVTVSLRARRSPGEALAAAIWRVRALWPELRPSVASPAADMVNGPYRVLQLVGLLMTALGSAALFLSMLGLYCALSYAMARRQREIGLRLALGAAPVQLRRALLRSSLVPVVQGLAIGLVVAWWLTMWLRRAIPGSTDAIGFSSMATVAMLTAVCAVAAAYRPVLNASRRDPSAALREL